MRYKGSLVVFGVVTIAAFTACGPSEDEPSAPENVAAIGMRLDPEFPGASVRLVGARSPFADAGGPCANTVSNCLNLESDGTSGVVLGLCASDDVPTGTWSFSYQVFNGPGCTGGSPPNFQCDSTSNLTLPAGVITSTQVGCGPP